MEAEGIYTLPVVEVENFLYATSQLAQTTLRSVLGQVELDELLAERSATDPLAKEIIESQHAYMKKARAWTQISDQAYLNSLGD